MVLSNVGWSDVSLLLGNGDGTLQAPTEFFLGGLFHYGGLAVADFDGNGTPDLAVAGGNDIFVLLNTAGSRAPAALLSAGTLSFGNESVGQTTSAQSVTLSYMASTALTALNVSTATGSILLSPLPCYSWRQSNMPTRTKRHSAYASLRVDRLMLQACWPRIFKI